MIIILRILTRIDEIKHNIASNTQNSYRIPNLDEDDHLEEGDNEEMGDGEDVQM